MPIWYIVFVSQQYNNDNYIDKDLFQTELAEKPPFVQE